MRDGRDKWQERGGRVKRVADAARDAGRRREKIVVGWNEYVDLPEWGIVRLGAKVDTGARSSALHVEDLEVLARGRVRFEVVVHREQRDRHVPVTARIVRRARVRSSNGQYEQRYFVETTLSLGGVVKPIEISLVDRGEMNHRMLLGRTALKGDFIVDVSRRHVQDPAMRRRKRAKAKARRKLASKAGRKAGAKARPGLR